jgi:hypothetical protein
MKRAADSWKHWNVVHCRLIEQMSRVSQMGSGSTVSTFRRDGRCDDLQVEHEVAHGLLAGVSTCRTWAD